MYESADTISGTKHLTSAILNTPTVILRLLGKETRELEVRVWVRFPIFSSFVLTQLTCDYVFNISVKQFSRYLQKIMPSNGFLQVVATVFSSVCRVCTEITFKGDKN